MTLMDEKSDPELELGSLINLEETIKADKKTFAVINSREEEEQIKKNKPVQKDKEVVDKDEELDSASLNKAKIQIPTKAPIPEFCYKIIFLVLLWIIFCSLMSPVRASDRPLLLAPDRCEIDWSTKPKDMQVTPGVEKTFCIKYECPSPVKKIQVVFNLVNGSTPINVWTLHDEKGNPTYNPVFNGQIQVWYDLKNGMVNVTMNNLIYQGSIGVRLDLPDCLIYIPPQKGYETKFPVLLWIIGLIFCSLMSPVCASEKCDYSWTNKPNDMSVTSGVYNKFLISYQCPSPVENIQVVFLRDNSSTPINVWSYDGRGNRTYNQVFNGHIQVWCDLKNGIVKVTVNHLIYQGSIGVWLDLPDGRIYIPLIKDGFAVNSTSRPTTRPTTSKVIVLGMKTMNSAEPISDLTILAIFFFILLILGVVLYIVVLILKPKECSGQVSLV